MAAYVLKPKSVEAVRVIGVPYEQWPEWTLPKVASRIDWDMDVVWVSQDHDGLHRYYYSDAAFLNDYEPARTL